VSSTSSEPFEVVNQVEVPIPWDVENYYDEHVKKGQDKKRKRYPNPHLGTFSEPLTVVDTSGRIVLWYLPGMLSSNQKVKDLVSVPSFAFQPRTSARHTQGDNQRWSLA
jgi:hypothetical protein